MGDATSNIVLGIPVPKEVQKLPRVPPMCYATEGDAMALEILSGLGRRQGVRKAEIARACDLLSGRSDVLIILERPRADRYDVMFNDFVQASDTLRSLDDLIRFSTRGALSIHAVSVVDAFSFQKEKDCTEFDLDCHQTLGQIIRTKKPKVIIRCHGEEYKDEWMKAFEFPAKEYRFVQKDVEIEDGHFTTVVQSFHMSCAVQNADYRPEYRALLIHHFVAAFAELHGNSQLPECAEDLRILCNRRGERTNLPFDTKYWAAQFTIPALSEPYDDLHKRYPVGFADRSRLERIEDSALAFYGMYQWLRLLAQGKCNPGSLALGRITLFNWTKFFKHAPLFNQVIWLLNARGVDQRSWISPKSGGRHTEKTKLSLAGILKELRLQKGPLAARNLDKMRGLLVDEIKERTPVVEECLRKTSVFDLAESLNFASMLAFYGEFVKSFDEDGYIFGSEQGGVRMDVLFLHRYLGEMDRFLSSRA
jgi:hypothetical protein